MFACFCVVMLISPTITHIKTVIENDIITRLQRDTLRTTMESHCDIPSVCIPVSMTNKSGIVHAKIDEEDKEMVTKYKNWRLTSSGYVLNVEKRSGKFQNTYLHKLVAKGTCKHINGDLLDNRKINLRSSFEIGFLPFDKTTSLLFDYRAIELEGYTGYATVDYPNRNRYSGHVRNGKPDGYGILVGEVESQQGIWVNGELDDGVVTNYCSCECNNALFHGIINCPLYEITRIDIVRGGVRQK